MKVAVMGPGAVGLYLLGSLAQKKRQPLLIDHKAARLSRLGRGGFLVIENGNEKKIPASAFSVQIKEPLDCVILAVKSHAVSSALPALKRMLKKDAVVIAIQNGVTHSKVLDRLGKNRVVYALFLAGCDRLEENKVAFFSSGDLPTLVIHQNAQNSQAVERAQELLNSSGIRSQVMKETLESLLWTKALFNAALNPVTALLMKKNGEILESAAAKDLIASVFSEGAQVLKAEKIRPAFPSKNPGEFPWAVLTQTAGNRSSMFQDIAAGRKTEADDIMKPFLDKARRHKIQCPTLEILYGAVKQYEKIRRQMA